ncbi:hypothetical protein NMG60_11009152 [Bertholletia excelsa]
MERGRAYAGCSSDMTVMLPNDALPRSSEVLESLWISSSSPSFHRESGSCSAASMVNFEDIRLGKPTESSCLPPPEKELDHGNEDYDGGCSFHHPEKKRRLTADQVQFLERNFEVENKLEPERKAQLAKEIGLQPRQVAIWFQNRRARFKTKQLEKDYGSLKAAYDRLKTDYDGLLKENESLKNEVRLLTDKLLLREVEKENSKPNNPIRQVVLEPDQKPVPSAASENKSKTPAMVLYKQAEEQATSAKSDVLDSSDSSHCTDQGMNQASVTEPAASSQAFRPDQSDFSQDEEEELARSFFPCFPKLEDGCYGDDPPATTTANCSNWSFPVVESQNSCFWSY